MYEKRLFEGAIPLCAFGARSYPSDSAEDMAAFLIILSITDHECDGFRDKVQDRVSSKHKPEGRGLGQINVPTDINDILDWAAKWSKDNGVAERQLNAVLRRIPAKPGLKDPPSTIRQLREQPTEVKEWYVLRDAFTAALIRAKLVRAGVTLPNPTEYKTDADYATAVSDYWSKNYQKGHAYAEADRKSVV